MPHLATSKSPSSFNHHNNHLEEDGTNNIGKQIIPNDLHRQQRHNSPSTSSRSEMEALETMLSLPNSPNQKDVDNNQLKQEMRVNESNTNEYALPAVAEEERGDKNVDDNDEAVTGGLLSLANSAQIATRHVQNENEVDNYRAHSSASVMIESATPAPPQRGVSKSPYVEQQQQQRASPSPAGGGKSVSGGSDVSGKDSKIITPTPMDKSGFDNEFGHYDDDKSSNSRPSSSMSMHVLKSYPGGYSHHDMYAGPHSVKSPGSARNRPQLYVQTDRLDEREWRQEEGDGPGASPTASTPSSYCQNLNEEGDRLRPPSASFPREVEGYGMRKRSKSASIEHQQHMQHGPEFDERGERGHCPNFDHSHHCNPPYIGYGPGRPAPPYYSPPHGHRYPHPSQKYPPSSYPGMHMHQYPPHAYPPYPPHQCHHYHPQPPARHASAASPDSYYYHPPHAHHYPSMYDHGPPPYHPLPPQPSQFNSANKTPPRSHQHHALPHEAQSTKENDSKLHQQLHSPQSLRATSSATPVSSRIVEEASTPPSSKKRRMISPIIVSSTNEMQSSSPDAESYRRHCHAMRDSGPTNIQIQQQPPNQTNNNNIAPTEINSVAQWQEVQIMNGGFAPSANRCVPLKSPVPSKFWGDVDKVKDSHVPDFHRLVNFPDYLPKNRPPPGDGMRCCVMCGKQRLCTASISKTSSSDNNTPVKTPKSAASTTDNIQSPSTFNSTTHIIPRQNKGLCTSCDVTVWVVTSSGLEIKWCKGCKNFRPWAAFGDKGLATKCVRCRDRQREKYALQKDNVKKRNLNGYRLSGLEASTNILSSLTTSATILESRHQPPQTNFSSNATTNRNEPSASFDKEKMNYNNERHQQSSEMDAARGLSNLLVAAVKSDETTAV